MQFSHFQIKVHLHAACSHHVSICFNLGSVFGFRCCDLICQSSLAKLVRELVCLFITVHFSTVQYLTPHAHSVLCTVCTVQTRYILNFVIFVSYGIQCLSTGEKGEGCVYYMYVGMDFL